MEQQAAALEQALKQWTKAVWRVLQEQGQAKEQEWLALSLDGKHLKGSARRGVGDRALVLVSAYLGQLGLSLMQREVQGDEAVAGRRLLMALEADLAEFGIPWVLTGDAAHTKTQTAAAVGALPARAQGEPGGVERLGRVCAEVSRRGGSP
ncbi:hypothetical protein J3L12_16640, partial [Meiothermus sp. CFH 77666]|nr:hypothetical protein [Meiothermus sp. CFH 77666]